MTGDCRFCVDRPPHPEATCLYRMARLATEADGEWGWYRDDVPYLLARIQQLEDALRWYADGENYMETDDGAPVNWDFGKIARNALSNQREEEPIRTAGVAYGVAVPLPPTSNQQEEG